MLRDEDRAQQRADREALRVWRAGDRARPFMLPLRPGYRACRLLLPSVASRIGPVLRVGAFVIIEKIPFSTCKVFLYRLMGVRIGRDAYIAPCVVLDPVCPSLIELQDDCLLGAGWWTFSGRATAPSAGPSAVGSPRACTRRHAGGSSRNS